MKWEEAIIVGLVSLIVVVIGLIIEYRTGLFHPTDSKRDRSILGRIIKALKPRPRLFITVRDVNCHVKTRTFVKDDRFSGRSRVQETTLQVEIAFKVGNKGRATATDVNASLKLIVGEGTNAFGFTTDPKARRRKFSLTTKQTLPLIVRFPPVELPQGEVALYPSSPYRLEYTYTCAERFRPQRVTVSGELTKVDWIGDPQALQTIKEMGFHR